MTLYQFTLLDEAKQMEAVESGIFLETFTDGVFNYLLYDLNGFYVELLYHPRREKVERLRPFRQRERLNAYIELANIDDLKLLLS